MVPLLISPAVGFTIGFWTCYVAAIVGILAHAYYKTNHAHRYRNRQT